jgi:hypothetical protein
MKLQAHLIKMVAGFAIFSCCSLCNAQKFEFTLPVEIPLTDQADSLLKHFEFKEYAPYLLAKILKTNATLKFSSGCKNDNYAEAVTKLVGNKYYERMINLIRESNFDDFANITARLVLHGNKEYVEQLKSLPSNNATQRMFALLMLETLHWQLVQEPLEAMTTKFIASICTNP